MSKPSQYEQHILKAAKQHPEQLTSVRSFARFVIKDASLVATESAMRYHVAAVADSHKLKFNADVSSAVADDLDRYKGVSSESRFKRQYNNLLGRYTALAEAYDDLLDIDSHEVKVMELEEERSASALKGQAVPIMQWSDWHVEKRIDAAVVNGVNEFNPEIAKYRAKVLAHNTARMLDIHQHANDISTGVLHLGGDFIEGYLRDGNLRENWMTPIEASIFAAELLISNIQYLLDADFFETLYVLCTNGNHPRLTDKMDGDDYKMNLETLIYHMVRQHFKDETRLTFIQPKSQLGMFEIMGKRIRFIHGHQIKYQGGIGGMAIPLRKAILNWDATQKADETLLGHYHQSHKPLHNVMMNGSLCGYDPYAQDVVKAEFQAPLQSMEMLVSGRGFRMFTSIDCQ